MQRQEETTAQPTAMTIDARDADLPRAIGMFFFFFFFLLYYDFSRAAHCAEHRR